MERHSFSIMYYIRKDRIQEKGQYPLYLRLTINGKSSIMFLDRLIELNSWDVRNNRVKATHPDSDDINQYLELIRKKIYDAHKKILDAKKPLTARSILLVVKGEEDSDVTLLGAINYHNKLMEKKVGKSYSYHTYKNFKGLKNHISQFLPYRYKVADIFLSQVDHKFLVEFESYLKTVKMCGNNGAMKHLAKLKKIIRLSIHNDWMQTDPYRNYKIRLEKVDRLYLTADELQKLENVKITNRKLKKVCELYIFSCYTGLAYGELKSLSGVNVARGIDGNWWLIGSRHKSGVRYSVPLLPQSLAILQKYHTGDDIDTPVFPVMSNQKMNDYLKDVAILAGINKAISFHSARHTFATTVTLTNGVPIETVSKMLGHTDLKTTQIYARVVDSKISDDMRKLREKLTEIEVELPGESTN